MAAATSASSAVVGRAVGTGVAADAKGLKL